MDKTLILLRGLPGAGKTTLAKQLSRAICSADDYFVINGKYNWIKNNIGDAHVWCRRKCRRFMSIGVDVVVVANTLTTE